MKNWIAELLIFPGFISFEYGLYLCDPKLALIVGGIISMLIGLLVAKNGAN